MKTVGVREFTRHLPRVTEEAQGFGGVPVLVTKGKPALRLGVWLTFETAVRRGIVCRHGEEPLRCYDCKPPEDPDRFWEDLVFKWAALDARYRSHLVCGEPLAAAALDRLLASGRLVVVRKGDTPATDLIKTAELAAQDGDEWFRPEMVADPHEPKETP